MDYHKEPLNFEAQAELLIDRGLEADRDDLVKRLSQVSYYRLSGYLFPFRQGDGDTYVKGTCFETVWRRYCFDRQLRVLLIDAIERVEVAVRTQLVFHFAQKYGPFGYCCEENLPKLKVMEYLEWRESLIVETQRSKEAFKRHFFEKYGDSHQNLPIWMLSELMSMGSLLSFLKGVDPNILSQVAGHFGIADQLLFSWLRSLYAARNNCAHHARVWNRVFGYPPVLPQRNKYPEWHMQDSDGKNLLKRDKVGLLMMICAWFVREISASSQWQCRVEALFDAYPEIPCREMGLPDDWRSHPVWQPKTQTEGNV